MAAKFFLYVRKSSESEERQALSIESQIAELKEFAAKENLTIKKIFTEAQSAKIPGRTIFNEMISCIEKGEASGIISWHPDRLARNSVDGGRIVYLLDTKHIQFLKFPTFWFENTPQGKFMLNIAFGQSKYYVDNLSENVKRGQRQKLRRGEWPGWAPLGYINDKNLRKVVPDPVNAPHVKKLFETYATGKYTLQDLKKFSFEWGLMSRKNNPVVKAEIQRTLKRSFYYGLMLYNCEPHQGTHEPLITKELFDQVQAVMNQKSRPKIHKKFKFPLLGLAHCKTCGGAITAERQKGHHYYRCTKKKGPCAEPYVREELLAEQISKAISSVALSQFGFDTLMTELNSEKQHSSQTKAQQAEQIELTTKEINAKLQRLLDCHLEGLVDKLEFQDKKSELLSEKIALEEKQKKLNKRAFVWLEPCANFLKAAHQATLLAQSDDLESQKNFLKKAGSNHLLAARRLHFFWRAPWTVLVKNKCDFNFLENTAGKKNLGGPLKADPEKFQNAIQLSEMRKR